jgi:hypothetical protein
MSSAEADFRINVGPINGLRSVCRYLGRPLSEFSSEFTKGRMLDVTWDLSNVEPRHMSMAGLTAFLAIAHRMREFTGHAQKTKCRWDPEVFGFWDDVALFRISARYGILDWQEGMLGGYQRGATNPHTKIIVFDYEEAPSATNVDEWRDWKDDKREEILADLFRHCGKILQSDFETAGFSDRARDAVVLTAAELALNSILHGRATSFVGIQRTRRGITVSVCDCGIGFARTVGRKVGKKLTDIQALFLGSLVNSRELGLRRAIDTLIEHRGYVLMSSCGADLRWETTLWSRAKKWLQSCGTSATELPVPDIREVLGEPSRDFYESKRDGGYWLSEIGVRGSRISFELPFSRRD